MIDPAARARVEAWMNERCPHPGVYEPKHYCPDCLLAFADAQRAEEREATADWYRETFCPRSGVEGDEKHARGDCEPCNLAHAIRARREGRGEGTQRLLTPAAQAVLEAAVTWESALTAMMPGLVVGDPMLADPLASRLYNAIRRYRETLPA